MTQKKYPPGWDKARVERVVRYYESQTEEEAIAEDEAVFEASDLTLMAIPNDLVPEVRGLLAKHNAA